jgi:hypothetical protein
MSKKIGKSTKTSKIFANIINMLKTAQITIKCVESKCKIESKNIKVIKKDTETQIAKLRKDLHDKKIKFPEYKKKVAQLKIKMIKTKERDDVVSCQLQKCQKETKNMINLTLDNLLNSSFIDKKSKIYMLASKYKKLFKDKNNMTVKNINQYDIDFAKIRA